jgi:O-succinylhomoserine sulfhydrylase
MKYKSKETGAIRNSLQKSQYNEHTTPVYLTSGFVFDDAEDMRASFAEEKNRNIYSRFTNPNTSEFVEKVCEMEGAEAGYAFASGMAAVFQHLLLCYQAVIIFCLHVRFLVQHTLFLPGTFQNGILIPLFSTLAKLSK